MADCLHFVVDEDVWDNATGAWRKHRRCLLCGVSYDRDLALAALQEWTRSRYRVGPLLPDEDEEDE